MEAGVKPLELRREELAVRQAAKIMNKEDDSCIKRCWDRFMNTEIDERKASSFGKMNVQDYYGIRGFTHKWITSWLSGRFQKVVLDGQASDQVPVLSGVPQGSVLGPVLFLIFINDLPENIRSSVRLFADDCVLYRNIESPTDCQILQDDLNSLAQWEADWQMKFNVAKCHSMRVTRHPPDKHIQFECTLHQQRLEQVQSAKYLGITISDDLDWGQHISEISSKATKTLGFLQRNLAFAPSTLRKLHTKQVAYKTLVPPKHEYAAPI